MSAGVGGSCFAYCAPICCAAGAASFSKQYGITLGVTGCAGAHPVTPNVKHKQHRMLELCDVAAM